MAKSFAEFMEQVKTRDPNQTHFYQAVDEVISSIWTIK